MRALAAVFYCIVITIVTLLTWSRWGLESPRNFVAARSLTENELIEPGDIISINQTAIDGLSGKYLVRSISKDEVIHIEDLAATPVVGLKPGSVGIVLRADKTDVAAHATKAGATVRICQNDKEVLGTEAGSTVSAIFCRASESSCSSIVQVSTGKASPILEALKANQALSVRPLNRNCG